MGRAAGNKSSPRKGSPLLTGLLVGMVIGVAMAAGLAWFMMKSPSPFVPNRQASEQPAVAPAPGAPAAETKAGEKPRFDFYKVLTDKQDNAAPSAARSQSPAVAQNPAAAGGAHYLQVGSFANSSDAEKLKVRLALMGFEANVQTAELGDRGIWHRVRLGPYKTAADLDKARAALKQNGIDATPTPAQ
jgi:cell division protein FtsN